MSQDKSPRSMSKDESPQSMSKDKSPQSMSKDESPQSTHNDNYTILCLRSKPSLGAEQHSSLAANAAKGTEKPLVCAAKIKV